MSEENLQRCAIDYELCSQALAEAETREAECRDRWEKAQMTRVEAFRKLQVALARLNNAAREFGILRVGEQP